MIELWTLLPDETKLLRNKTGPTRLGFAVMLKAFQHEMRFPYNAHEVPDPVIDYVDLIHRDDTGLVRAVTEAEFAASVVQLQHLQSA